MDYEQRIADRRDRLAAAAARAGGEAQNAQQSAVAVMNMIPMGQPILVGHHSERRHRRDIDRIHARLAKAAVASKRAQELLRRSLAVGMTGRGNEIISSDDPAATAKLQEKIEELKSERENMKRVNAAYRRGGLEAMRLEFPNAAPKLERDMRFHVQDRPFPSFKLTNIGAEIRRAEARLAALIAAATEPDHEPVRGNGFTITEDRDENRIRFEFDKRPSDIVCKLMRQAGWKWNRRLGAWTRHLNSGGRASSQYVSGQLSQMESLA